MSYSFAYLHIVDENTTESSVELKALGAIKDAMYDALVVQDWSTLKCLDRVCGRMINTLCMRDHAYMKKVMSQLSEIKQIYKIALEEMHPHDNKAPIRAI
ncbi:MAG: hypothetical protein ACRBCS_13685 [Cellvibrionaceae bacterium]